MDSNHNNDSKKPTKASHSTRTNGQFQHIPLLTPCNVAVRQRTLITVKAALTTVDHGTEKGLPPSGNFTYPGARGPRTNNIVTDSVARYVDRHVNR